MSSLPAPQFTPPCRALFSRNWELRAAALTHILDGLKAGTLPADGGAEHARELVRSVGPPLQRLLKDKVGSVLLWAQQVRLLYGLLCCRLCVTVFHTSLAGIVAGRAVLGLAPQSCISLSHNPSNQHSSCLTELPGASYTICNLFRIAETCSRRQAQEGSVRTAL